MKNFRAAGAHGRTGRKKLRGRKEICPTFSDCARVVDGGGRGGRNDYEKFLLDNIFPTKLTEFVPFIFIISQYCPTVKRILPDWLCLPNKLGGGGGGPPGTPMPMRAGTRNMISIFIGLNIGYFKPFVNIVHKKIYQ
jgi:hypothetical protein